MCMKIIWMHRQDKVTIYATVSADDYNNFSTQTRVMTYSSISMLPMLLTILLLVLEHTSEGFEYHVKPTDPQVTQCPGQPCHTLAEYLEDKTWDYTYHTRVVFMPGHYRIAQSFLVRFALCLVVQVSTTLFMIHVPSSTLLQFGFIISTT